jgi:hypothetical protein
MKLVSEVSKEVRGVAWETDPLAIPQINIFSCSLMVSTFDVNGVVLTQVHSVGAFSDVVFPLQGHHYRDAPLVFNLLASRDDSSIQSVELNLLNALALLSY